MKRSGGWFLPVPIGLAIVRKDVAAMQMRNALYGNLCRRPENLKQ